MISILKNIKVNPLIAGAPPGNPIPEGPTPTNPV